MLAARHGVDPGRVIVTAGADEALERVVLALLGEGREIVYPVPSFEVIERYSRLAGARIVEVPWLQGVYPRAEVLAAIYRLRWSIELFFRFLKHVLGCRHLLSHKSEGVAIQVYCALIAALLMSHLTGQSVGKRGFELVCLYLSGWAEEDELAAGIERLVRRKTKG